MNIKQKANEFRSIVTKMADLYEKKNSNYGDSFGQLYKELGPIAGLVPLWNKLHRATSLIKGGENHFESLEDTLKDLACYAIMNLIEMKAEQESRCHSRTEKYIDNENSSKYSKRMLDIDINATNVYTLGYEKDSLANLDYTHNLITKNL